MNKFQEATLVQAIMYARKGWHVFPCNYNKTPKTQNGFYDASTDEDQIQKWWESDPKSLIGIRTGRESGFWVVDVDMKNGKDGIQSLKDHFGNKFELSPKQLIQKTGSGGFHFLYKWNDQYPVSSKKDILSGVDTRGEGGYIIAAPSSINVDGEWVQYRWNNEDEPKEVIEAQEWAVEFASMTQQHIAKKINLSEAVTNGIPSGSRDEDLFRIARLLARDGVSMESTTEVILYLANKCKPPFDHSEAIKKVESAYGYQNNNQQQAKKFRIPEWKRK